MKNWQEKNSTDKAQAFRIKKENKAMSQTN